MITTDNIRSCSDLQGDTPLPIRVAKLVEETGETAAAMLACEGSINASASAQENIEEELVDVLIVAFDILHARGYNDVSIQNLMDQKCAKWRRKIERRRHEQTAQL